MTGQNRRTYVVGDIHGDHAGLLSVLSRFRHHGLTEGRDRLIFLGDYVDGHEHSAQVVATVRELDASDLDVVALMGNHEALLLDGVPRSFADQRFQLWYRQGGSATARSYGAAPRGFDSILHVPPRLRDDMAWMASLPLRFEDDRRHYVHAGFRPGVPLDQQIDEDLLWIREPFLDDRRGFGKLVVFGHTARKTPGWIDPTKICLDTSHTGGGCVSGVVFDDPIGQVTFVSGPPAPPVRDRP